MATRQAQEIMKNQAAVDAQHENKQFLDADYERERQLNMKNYLDAMRPLYYRNPMANTLNNGGMSQGGSQ
jgi:hypothetical protein